MKKLICFTLTLCAILLTITSCGHVHNFGGWTVTKRPTCTEDGMQERFCSCGAKQTMAVASTGHSFGEWKTTKDPTCTKPGEQERICDCGEKKTQSIEAGHKYGERETVLEPTCTMDGSEESICTICGYKQTNTLTFLGHDWDENRGCRRCGLTELYSKMTDKEKAAAKKVEKFSYSISAKTDEIRIYISFKDNNGNYLETPAYVEVRIVNSKKTVYNKTLVLSSTDSYVSIGMSEVNPGTNRNGTIYFFVYCTNCFAFKTISKNIENLPRT